MPQPVVPAPAAASPESSDRSRHRTFSARDTLRILADTDCVARTGGIGTVPQRIGLYSSTLSDCGRQRDKGAFGATFPARYGPKIAEATPLNTQVARLQKDNARLAAYLTRAEAIIDPKKSGRAARHPVG